MRFEYFMPTSNRNATQFVVSCALVNVIGAGGGTPTNFVKFPGAYNMDDPGELRRVAMSYEYFINVGIRSLDSVQPRRQRILSEVRHAVDGVQATRPPCMARIDSIETIITV
jgi:hypothetical protein